MKKLWARGRRKALGESQKAEGKEEKPFSGGTAGWGAKNKNVSLS